MLSPAPERSGMGSTFAPRGPPTRGPAPLPSGVQALHTGGGSDHRFHSWPWWSMPLGSSETLRRVALCNTRSRPGRPFHRRRAFPVAESPPSLPLAEDTFSKFWTEPRQCRQECGVDDVEIGQITTAG